MPTALDTQGNAPKASAIALLWQRKSYLIALLSIVGISLHLLFRYGLSSDIYLQPSPLFAVLILGGTPLILELLGKALKREFGSDLLGGISIVTSILLGEYLAGSIIVLMLSGGEALESYALRNASSVLEALAKRMPSHAHRKSDGYIHEVRLVEISVGDTLVVYPHEICPADGVVTEGHGVMDESYLTGEPYKITKTNGSAVISGAINGDAALTIKVSKIPADSRYAKIMEVMRASEAKRPHIRRLGDKLGALYTPLALAIAIAAWVISGESMRFLAVLVIATPCPLLIGIPIAVIGTISLCARRSIIVKKTTSLEQISTCKTAIFDKTGTLTYGEPTLTEVITPEGSNTDKILSLIAGMERYSKHPLSRAVITEANKRKLDIPEASEVSEQPGKGLHGLIAGHELLVSSRNKIGQQQQIEGLEHIPPVTSGLECIVAIDGRYAATLRFHDAPRSDSRPFISHLGPKHQFEKVMIVSGDRESEVQYLASEVGITEIHAQQSPEQKLDIVTEETSKAKTLYLGDGINDAPAMMASTVGIAIGQNSEVTTEAASVIIMDNTLVRVDEFMHISRRMRAIALQSAVGGMALSLIGMAFAAAGYITPVQGAILQEVIDVLAILNALRAAVPPKVIHDL